MLAIAADPGNCRIITRAFRGGIAWSKLQRPPGFDSADRGDSAQATPFRAQWVIHTNRRAVDQARVLDGGPAQTDIVRVGTAILRATVSFSGNAVREWDIRFEMTLC
jgi:hypothetical protein